MVHHLAEQGRDSFSQVERKKQNYFFPGWLNEGRCPGGCPSVSWAFVKACSFFGFADWRANRPGLTQAALSKKNEHLWKLCMLCQQLENLKETRENREGKEDSLTESVKSNSIGENLLVPSDQGT